jgi:hypothetical protein
MNFSRLVTDTLWIFPLVLQAAILFVIVRRKLLRTFAVFFAYTGAVLSREIVLLFLPYPGVFYAAVYWYGEAITVLLGLGAIFETFRYLFPPYPFLKAVLKLFWVLGAVASVGALLMLVLTQVQTGGDHAFELIILGERSIRFVEACWLILIIAFVSHLGRGWQQYSVGVVAGFGTYAALTLTVFELRAHLHMVSNSLFVVLNSAAYNVAAIIWAFYFVRSWSGVPAKPLPATNLTEWNDAVTQYYTQQWYRRY